MSRDTAYPAAAWQPFTFDGVASFARSSPARLGIVAAAVALFVACAMVWTLYQTWFPAIEAAIDQLPPHAAINQGRLDWPTNAARVLADNTFLAIVAVPVGEWQGGQSADVQLELQASGIQCVSLLGSRSIAYPAEYHVSLDRDEVLPRWGAWRPHILAGIGLVTIIVLVLLWVTAATLLALPLRLFAALLRRSVTLGGCWRLAVAGLLPGPVFLSLALILYALRRLGPAALLVAAVLSLGVCVLYLVCSVIALPTRDAVLVIDQVPQIAGATNPFAGARVNPETGASVARNPFTGHRSRGKEQPELKAEPPPADHQPSERQAAKSEPNKEAESPKTDSSRTNGIDEGNPLNPS